MKINTILLPIALIFLLALSIRSIYVPHIIENDRTFYTFPKNGDSHYLDTCASKISAGEELKTDKPLYAAFLSAAYTVFDKSRRVPVRLIHFIFGGLTASILCGISIYLFGKRVGYIAGCLAALYAPFIFYEGKVLIATSQVFFMALIFLFLLLAEKKKSIFSYVCLGSSIGLMAIDRNNILLFVPVYLFILSVRSSTIKQKVSHILTLCTSLFIPFIALSVFYYGMTRSIEFLSNPGAVHLYRGNVEGATGTYLPLSMLPPVPNGHYVYATLQSILAHPVSWVHLMVQKTKYFFWYYEILNNFHFEFEKELYFPLTYLPAYGSILPLGMLGLFLSFRKRKSIKIVSLLASLYAASIILFFVIARYRLPFVVILFPFAAYTIDYLFLSRTVKKRNKIYAFIACLTLITLVHIPYQKGHYYYLRMANESLAKNNYTEAISFLNKGIDHTADKEEFYLKLAFAYVKLGNHETSITLLQKGVRELPTSAKLHNNLGYLYNRSGNDALAITHYEKALELEPHFVEALLNSAAFYYKKNRFREAALLYKKALATNKASEAAYINLGVILQNTGKIDEAITLYTKGLRFFKKSHILFYSLGVAHINKGNDLFAIRALEEATLLHKENAQYFQLLGTAYLNIKQYNAAVIASSKALTLNPSLANAYYCRAAAHFALGLLEKAQKDLSHVKELPHTINPNFLSELEARIEKAVGA